MGEAGPDHIRDLDYGNAHPARRQVNIASEPRPVVVALAYRRSPSFLE